MWTHKFAVTVAIMLAFWICSPADLFAQTDKEKSRSEKKVAKKSDKDKDAAKPRGQLPHYYRHVVDNTQRDKIYEIQAKYRQDSKKLTAEIEQLARDLRKKLAALKTKQDKEITAILTPTQRTQVAKLRAAAAAEKRKERSSVKSAPKKSSTSKKKDS